MGPRIFLRALWIVVLFIFHCNHFEMYANDSLRSDSVMQAYALKCKVQTKSPAVLQMCDTLLQFAKENNNTHLQVIAQCFKLEYYYYINDEENILKYVEEVKEVSRKYNELKYYYFAWGNRLITYYIKQNKINTAIYETKKMLRKAQADHYPSGIASCYRALANIYITQSNQKLALENFQKEIDVMEENNINDLNLATEYASLAQSAISTGDMERAEKALEIPYNRYRQRYSERKTRIRIRAVCQAGRFLTRNGSGTADMQGYGSKDGRKSLDRQRLFGWLPVCTNAAAHCCVNRLER